MNHLGIWKNKEQSGLFPMKWSVRYFIKSGRHLGITSHQVYHQETVNLGSDIRRVLLIASEARKAVGLSRSLAIRQLSVCVYDATITIRNTYTDPESCHRPTCGTTISLNVRTTSVLEDFFSRLSNDRFHWSTMTLCAVQQYQTLTFHPIG